MPMTICHPPAPFQPLINKRFQDAMSQVAYDSHEKLLGFSRYVNRHINNCETVFATLRRYELHVRKRNVLLHKENRAFYA